MFLSFTWPANTRYRICVKGCKKRIISKFPMKSHACFLTLPDLIINSSEKILQKIILYWNSWTTSTKMLQNVSNLPICHKQKDFGGYYVFEKLPKAD